MRILAIETATANCSVALIEDGRVIASDAATVGRGHAERLLPMIAALPAGGLADAIHVDCGPGSFTGVRVGIAAARALGFGWAVPVHGFSSLMLIAATWFASSDATAVEVLIEGGHGEVFVQSFGREPLSPTTELQSLAPEAIGPPLLMRVGNAAVRVSTLNGFPPAIDCMPDARNAALLVSVSDVVRPIYGRAPDAKPMAA